MILAKYELLKEKVLKVTITLYNVPYHNTRKTAKGLIVVYGCGILNNCYMCLKYPHAIIFHVNFFLFKLKHIEYSKMNFFFKKYILNLIY